MRLLGLMLLGLMLTSCQCLKTRTTATINSIPCPALKVQSYSATKDTAQTVTEVREFNAVYKELCK
jgi:hypothetical protein